MIEGSLIDAIVHAKLAADAAEAQSLVDSVQVYVDGYVLPNGDLPALMFLGSVLEVLGRGKVRIR